MKSTAMSQRVLSCIQPTAAIHIGNYFGAIQNWVKLQADYDCIYGVVDLHAMTVPYRREELSHNTYEMLVALIACGVDPIQSRLFVQSCVPEHVELCWILATACGYGDLARMTQFKDKSRQLRDAESDSTRDAISAGLFFYPILQAADILAYRPAFVPVGRDQQQHLELCRSIAKRFNQQYAAELFSEPATIYTKIPKVMSLTQPDKKMSKSLGEANYVGLFDDPDLIRRKVRGAVTDSGDLKVGQTSPGVANLLTILNACGDGERASEMRREYRAGRLKYVHLKDAVATALVSCFSPMRERQIAVRERFVHSTKWFEEISRPARLMAAETVDLAREACGIGRLSRRFIDLGSPE